MTQAAAGLSWQEFLNLPDDPAVGHAEPVDGEVVASPPSPLHELLVLAIAAGLRPWTLGLGGSGVVTMEPVVRITDRRGYLPDVAWFPANRCTPPGEPLAFTGPPALAVEVSPGTRVLDSQRKRSDYARVGVDELWLVDPVSQAVPVPRPAAGQSEFAVAADLDAAGTLTSPLLPGLALGVPGLFAR